MAPELRGHRLRAIYGSKEYAGLLEFVPHQYAISNIVRMC